TIRNYLIGYYIVEYEQNGNDRAKYGAKVLESMADNLKHIKGLSTTNLRLFRQFYSMYPQIHQSLTDESKINLKIQTNKLLTHLTFTHFVELIKIDDKTKRLCYEVETIKGNWSVRELKRQIEILLYERIGLSKDKNALLKSLNCEKKI
ncbi:MAG TPA: cytoplasmic protein, partial [Sulfurimonas sp. UBA12504]